MVVAGYYLRFSISTLLVILGFDGAFVLADPSKPSNLSPLQQCVYKVSKISKPTLAKKLKSLSEAEVRLHYQELMAELAALEDVFEKGEFVLATSRGSKIKAELVDFMKSHLIGAGEAFEIIHRDLVESVRVPAVRVLPSGSALGRYAQFLKERFGGELVYSPFELEADTTASFQSDLNSIQMSHESFLSLSLDESFPHETQHMAVDSDVQQRGDHVLRTKIRRGQGLDDSPYFSNFTLDELSAYAHDLHRTLADYPLYRGTNFRGPLVELGSLGTSALRSFGLYSEEVKKARVAQGENGEWNFSRSQSGTLEFEAENLSLNFRTIRFEGEVQLLVNIKNMSSTKLMQKLMKSDPSASHQKAVRPTTIDLIWQGEEFQKMAQSFESGKISKELKQKLLLLVDQRLQAATQTAKESRQYILAISQYLADRSVSAAVKVPPVPQSLSFSGQDLLEEFLRSVEKAPEAQGEQQ